jgi:hypothetical protein
MISPFPAEGTNQDAEEPSKHVLEIITVRGGMAPVPARPERRGPAGSGVVEANIRIAAERLGAAILRNILKKLLTISSPGTPSKDSVITPKEMLTDAEILWQNRPPYHRIGFFRRLR